MLVSGFLEPRPWLMRLLKVSMGSPGQGPPEICPRVSRVPRSQLLSQKWEIHPGRAGEEQSWGRGGGEPVCVRARAGAGGPVFALWLALFMSLAIFSF